MQNFITKNVTNTLPELFLLRACHGPHQQAPQGHQPPHHHLLVILFHMMAPAKVEYIGSIFSLYGSWYFFWGIHSHTHTHTLRRNWAKNIWHTCWIQYSTKINCFRYHKLYHWFLSSFWSQLHSKLIDVFTQTSISPTGLSCPATYPPGPDQAIAAGKKNNHNN